MVLDLKEFPQGLLSAPFGFSIFVFGFFFISSRRYSTAFSIIGYLPAWIRPGSSQQ